MTRVHRWSWLRVLLALASVGACTTEGGHCLNPQPELPCTNASNGAGGSGTAAAGSGSGGELTIGDPSTGAAGAMGSAGSSSAAGGDTGAVGEGGADERGAAGDSGLAGEAGADTDSAGASYAGMSP